MKKSLVCDIVIYRLILQGQK